VKPRVSVAGQVDPMPAVVWSLRGRVKPVFVASPVWHLGRHSELSHRPTERTFEVETTVPVADLGAEVDSSLFRATVTKTGTANRFRVAITARHDLPVRGRVERDVRLRAVTPDGVRLPERRVSVRYEILPDLLPEPAMVLGGGAAVGSAVEARVAVVSVSGRAVAVEDARADTPAIEVSPAAGRNEYVVRQRVEQAGPQAGRVTFRVRVGGEVRRVELPVSVVGVEHSN
jgi:hypothetical protein